MSRGRKERTQDRKEPHDKYRLEGIGALLGLCPDTVPRHGDVEGEEAECVQLGRVEREVHVLRSAGRVIVRLEGLGQRK